MERDGADAGASAAPGHDGRRVGLEEIRQSLALAASDSGARPAADIVADMLRLACRLTDAEEAAFGNVGADGRVHNVTTLRRGEVVTVASPGAPGDWDGGAQVRFVATVPGEQGGSGLLRLTYRPGTAPPDHDVEIGELLASAAAVGLRNARTARRGEQQRRWLAAAIDVTRGLLGVQEDIALQLIVDTAGDLASCDAVGLALRTGDDDLVVRTTTATARAGVGHLLPSGAGTLAGTVLASGRPARGPGPFPGISAVVPELDMAHGAVIPLRADGVVLGLLYAGRGHGGEPFDDFDTGMLSLFADQAALALQLAQARADRLHLDRVEERERTAADLHDHVVQQLFSAGLQLTAVASATPDHAAADEITRTVDALDATIARIRTTIRRLHGFGPVTGTAPLLDQLSAVIDDATAQLGFSPEVHLAVGLQDMTGGDPHLADLADDLLAVVREALTNVARHAAATHVRLSVDLDEHAVVAVVEDDGRGPGPSLRRSGLRYAASRAERHGGSLTVDERPAGGTTFTWRAPRHDH